MVVETTVVHGIATLKLNRPESLNALNLEMIDALRDATAAVAHDPSIRAVILAGAGNHFMAGGDLNWFRDQLHLPAEKRRPVFERVVADVQTSILNLRQMPKPVIARVQGAAAGFGLSLVLACDFAVAADSAYFTLAYRHIGLSPDGGSSWVLPRLVGLKKAAEIAMLGDRFTAAEALSMGLINKVVPREELDAATEALARRLATGPREALARTKSLLNQAATRTLAEGLSAEVDGFASCAALPDFDEGLAAFFDKRPANFS
jgi:2-(1,2-epoxy-1,2-dihydrophenyl)acetyl-CoA isomerase